MDYSTELVLALISRIHTKSAEFTNSRLPQEKGLVSSHGFILFQLAEKEKLTMKDIASIINRDKSTTTVLIKKLLDKGLVKQESSSDDKRIKYITLTAKGKKLNTLTSSISKDLLKVCYKNFSEEEKQTLLSLLSKVSKNIEDSFKDSP
ncbi:MAG: MarR family transcriptional regulator [Treponema sp.]|nr:MarR family transcriptional regulator [Treponema sp.]